MRILIVHNQYRLPGGEDTVVEAETALLRSHGHTVKTLLRHSSVTESYGLAQKWKLLGDITWSAGAFDEVHQATCEFRADIVHAHNTHPLWSPSVFAAAHQAGGATVMTLHNYRLVCMNALMMRNGKSCSECLERGPYRGVLHGCGAGGRAGSLAMARLLASSRGPGSWVDHVDAFIALTQENARQTFIRGGLPAERIHVKPNFLEDPLDARPESGRREGAVFIGHLMAFKGVEMLLEAWRGVDYPLSVVGAGPLSDNLRAMPPPTVTFTGQLPLAATLDLLAASSFVVFPSLAREGFPRVIVEALALGRPVVASRHGAMAEIVADEQTGLLYHPGSLEDLRLQVNRLAGNAGLARRLGAAARREYLSWYTAAANYRQLMAIYTQALDRFGRSEPVEEDTAACSGGTRL